MLHSGKTAVKQSKKEQRRSMSWLGYAGLTAVLALPAGVPHAAVPPSLAFAPSQCGYAVSFPASPAVSQSTAVDGGMNVAADLVRGGVRFSAACLAAAPGEPSTPLPPADAAARMTQMTRALGVQDADVRALPKLGPGCGSVSGTLGDKTQPYRIEARICIVRNATFLAETIARAGTTDDTARKFLDSLAPK
jgi:hypothetical protein